MVIEEHKSTIISVGDIQQNKVSIDPRNIEFITTLLSSNLYSNPEESFMREIISNAWDSHVEAGTEDTAVIVKIDKDWVTIRDFGVGLSPERFKEIYLNIGSSTKRSDNTQLGGFGIGRMSALACSDTCHITSFYNGKKYYYIMSKDGNSINIDLLNTSDTEEKNGLSVSIKTNDGYKYNDSLKNLIFFPNVYVDSKNYTYYFNFNKAITKKFNYFAWSNSPLSKRILLGNVLYKLDSSNISESAKNYLNFLGDNIAIRFNIGELPVTPNRESILYNKNSIAKIEQRIKEACSEFCSIIAPLYNKNYDNSYQLARDLREGYITFDLLNISLASYRYGNYSVLQDKLIKALEELGFYKTYLNGKLVTKELRDKLSSCYYSLQFTKIPGIAGYIGSSIFYTTKVPYRYQRGLEFKGIEKVIKVSSDLKITPTIRRYLLENYTNYVVLRDLPLSSFSHIVKSSFIRNNTFTVDDDFIKDAYDFIEEKSTKFDINDTKYITFLLELKIEKENEKKDKNILKSTINVDIQYANSNGFVHKIVSNIEDFKKDFYKTKPSNTPTVVVNSRYEYINLLSEYSKYIRPINIISVAKQHISKFEDIKGVISVEKLLGFNNKVIKELYTFYNLFYFKPVISSTYSYYFNEDKLKLFRAYNKYCTILESYCIREYIKQIPKDREYDPYVKYVGTELWKVYDIIVSYGPVLQDAGILPRSVAFDFFMMKKKAFRIPYSVYKNIKLSPLFKK